jgi:hypothetical protein
MVVKIKVLAPPVNQTPVTQHTAKNITVAVPVFKHQTMMYWTVEVQFHAFLPSALARGQWSAISTGHIASWERVPGTHRIGIRMDPRGGHSSNEKELDLCLELNSSHPVHSL